MSDKILLNSAELTGVLGKNEFYKAKTSRRKISSNTTM
jgi:hypothetical protein